VTLINAVIFKRFVIRTINTV